MSYTAPYIDSNGLHLPSYSDIEASLIASAQSIFGQDIYLDNDSQDKQWISAITLMIYNTQQLCALAYNNESPQTATGVSLDNVIKLNGIARNSATYSTCIVVLQGVVGTVISAGVAIDNSNYLWDLPTDTTIGSDGTVTVTAKCETAGAITADIGTIQTISNPQYGWNQIYNAVAATPGVAIETDQALHTRQSESVALPSQTVLEGMLAAILAIDGVEQAKIYENKTTSTDSNGIPANSIAAVVDGGDATGIATEISLHKSPGCGTYGSSYLTSTDTQEEVNILSLTTAPTADGNVTITLNGIAITVAVLSTDTTTTAATKIRSTSFTGWTTGGSGTSISFTSSTLSTSTPIVFSGGSTGAAGSVSTVNEIKLNLGDNILTTAINFFRPTAATITATVTVIPLTGYTQTVQNSIETNSQSYINSLTIGTSVYASSLFSAALSAMASLKSPSFSISSITVSKDGGTASSSAAIAWNEIATAGAITIVGGL